MQLSNQSLEYQNRKMMKLTYAYLAIMLISISFQVHTATAVASVTPDELSLVTRYAGMGYNALMANPEGEFSRAAVNPGIKTTRFIFNHTYCNGNQVNYRGTAMKVPDQVVWQTIDSCASVATANAYSGQTSYKRKLSESVEISASYDAIVSAQFSLSSAMDRMKQTTENQRSVVIQKTRICNYGQARYKIENALANQNGYDLTTEFKSAVSLLPTSYSANHYIQFLDEWGTHIIETVSVGTREITRSLATYLEVYEYLSEENSNGVNVEGSNGIVTGSVSLNLNILDSTVSHSTQLGSSLTELTIGSVDVPLPIHTKVIPIDQAFADNLWSQSERTSYSIASKRTNIERALRDYANNKQAQIAPDPTMTIDFQWPRGHFTILKAASGCPTGMYSGWRFQDNEDNNNENSWRPSDIQSCIDFDVGRNLKTYYCTKRTDGGSPSWPSGTYCIARHGDDCPSGFFEGLIHWDDEDSNNINSEMLPLPSGRYDRNTEIDFCCRSDGNHDIPMTLPPTQAFALYRYEGTCQKVRGMNDPIELFVHYDDEDSNNANRCSGNHPGGSCIRNHELYFCYYTPLSTNKCNMNPCQNGGTCVSTVQTCTGYTCQCGPNNSGTHCEHLYGNLRFDARYARNLRDSDGWWNDSDPYMEIIAEDADGNTVRMRTRYIGGNHNPNWNQRLDFGRRAWKKFKVRVYDDDDNADDPLSSQHTRDLSIGTHRDQRFSCYDNGYAILDYFYN